MFLFFRTGTGKSATKAMIQSHLNSQVAPTDCQRADGSDSQTILGNPGDGQAAMFDNVQTNQQVGAQTISSLPQPVVIQSVQGDTGNGGIFNLGALPGVKECRGQIVQVPSAQVPKQKSKTSAQRIGQATGSPNYLSATNIVGQGHGMNADASASLYKPLETYMPSKCPNSVLCVDW